jgi:hypothetical protein
MIFRAMVSAYPNGLPERAQAERVVFIEAVDRDDVRNRLPCLVATVWQVPVESLDICNLESEFELSEGPFSEGQRPEHALFEIGGSGSKRIYADGITLGGHPLFFLANQLDRVMNAYMSLPRGSVRFDQAKQQ